MLSAGIYLALLSLPLAQATSKFNLTIGGIFDMETKVASDNSANMIPAVQMALDHINSDQTILKDYHLNLDIKDVKCKASYTIKAMVDFVRETQTQKIMVIGPGCAESAEAFAKASFFYNLVQISMANANPALGCKLVYKTFVRTVPPEHYQNRGRLKLIQSFGWTNVAVVQESLDTLIGLATDLIERFKQHNINVITNEIFKDDPKLAIENFKKKDARILLGMFRETAARRVMCEAYKQGLWGPKYVWVLMSSRYRPNWMTINDTSCTPEQVQKAAGFYFGTKAMVHNGTDVVTIAGRTIKDLEDEYSRRTLHSYGEINTYASYAYDATWVAALGLQKSLEQFDDHNETRGRGLEHFTYDDNFMGRLFMKNVRHVKFYGMSGELFFDRKYERVGGTLQIEQMQDKKLKKIGEFEMLPKKLRLMDNVKPKWQGTNKPVSHAEKVHVHRYIEKSAIFFLSTLCLIGAIFAVAFLVFNIRYKHIRYIKMSSPSFNNIILVGCILIYMSGIVAGVDGQFVSEKTQKILCQFQPWMVSIGFTLAFGALFSKTWRVHVIFLKKTERKVIKDNQLFGHVLAFLVIDIIVLICWQVIDPLYVKMVDMAPEVLENSDTILLPHYSHCTCQHMTVWTGLLYGYKGFLLIFGTYLAWETRTVSIPVLNDSKTIGISIYNVVVPCILVIPILHVIKDNVSIIYGMTALLCILCTTVTQCLIFIPKVFYILYRKPGQDDASQFSTIPKGAKKDYDSQLSHGCETSSSAYSSTTSLAPRGDAYAFKSKDEAPPLPKKQPDDTKSDETKQENVA